MITTSNTNEGQGDSALMTQNGMSLFQNEALNCSVRAVARDGEPWFVAKDICDVLEIGNSRQAVSYLDDDEKGVITNDTPGGMQQVSIINESGLYSLVLRSRKPEAKRFKKWVTAEVLPSIRKHGVYATAPKLEELLADPDTMIVTLQLLKAEREQRKALEARVADDQPKVLFARAVETSKNSVLIGELAKILRQNGVEIGAKRLFARLRAEGYLGKRGEEYNMPTQRAMELSLFEVKKGAYVGSDGSNHITRTPKVTGRGQIYFVGKYIKQKAVPA